MNPTSILSRARELIEKGWTQGVAARQQNGREVGSNHPTACKFCMIGALNRASHEAKIFSYEKSAIQALVENSIPKEWRKNHESNLKDIAQFNDAPERTKEQVLEVFDNAIRSANPGSREGFNSAA